MRAVPTEGAFGSFWRHLWLSQRGQGVSRHLGRGQGCRQAACSVQDGPHSKGLSGQNVKSAQVEKPCLSVFASSVPLTENALLPAFHSFSFPSFRNPLGSHQLRDAFPQHPIQSRPSQSPSQDPDEHLCSTAQQKHCFIPCLYTQPAEKYLEHNKLSIYIC